MLIASLHIYPIKGCRGHAVSSVGVDRLGLEGDRRLMLVDHEGTFLSQRKDPLLATITPRLEGDSIALSAPNAPAFRCSLTELGERRKVTIWSDSLMAVDQGEHAADWFSAILGHRVRLVKFGDPSHRSLDPQFTPRPDAEVAFADGYPLLVTTEASLADLNNRLDEAVPMGRFRPNAVLNGATPWAEDNWRQLQLGDLECDVVKPCARCVVPATDQFNGTRHPDQEPLRTLAEFRTQKPHGAIFGQNVVPRGVGRIEVGDACKVD